MSSDNVIASNRMVLGKETKNTFRFDGEGDGRPAPIRNLYLEKWKIPNGEQPPTAVEVVIREVEE